MPTTANFMSKLSIGRAEDLATTVLLASNKDILLVPAMNVRMWLHKATQANLKILTRFWLFISLVLKKVKWLVVNLVKENVKSKTNLCLFKKLF